AEKMVDPVYLLLVEYRMDDPVQLAEILAGSAERLLVDHAGVTGQPVLAKRLRQPGEGGGWNGQVMDELRVAAQRVAGLVDDVEQAARALGAETAAREEHPLGEGVPVPLDRLDARVGERFAEAGAEVLVRHVPAAVPDQPPLLRQQPFAGQPVERGEHHSAGQVPGRTEKHEDRRSGIASGPAMLRHSGHEITLLLAPDPGPGGGGGRTRPSPRRRPSTSPAPPRPRSGPA